MTAHAVPVAITGWTTSTYLLAVLNVLFGGGLVAGIIKVWPQIKQIAASARRSDIERLEERVGTLETQVLAANNAAHRSEMKLVYAINAIQLLAGRIRSDNPDDPILKQANDMLQLATTGEMSIWMRDLDVASKVKAQKEAAI